MRVTIACVALAAASLAVATSCSAEPAASAVAAQPARSGPPAGQDMEPSFSEEFSGGAVDRRKWNTALGPRTSDPPVGSRTLWSNGERQIYFDRKYLKLGIDPFTVADGVLTISARPLSAAARDKVFGDVARFPDLLRGFKEPPKVEYSSGVITTRDLFAQRYGYFEIRAAWTGGKGVWPAFWLLREDGAWPPEIDVLEAHGDKPEVAWHSVHSSVDPRTTKTAQIAGSPADFHLYGVLWSPGRLDFFVDGVPTGSVAEPADMNKPMYLIANLAIGGYWPGFPDPDPNFAASMRIDHIRAWRFRKGAAGAGAD